MPANSAELDAMVVALAAIIDTHEGDYPLVSFCSNAPGPHSIWLYADLVVEVFIDKDKPASIRSRVPGGVSICVNSLEQSMELLRRTEGLRQQRDWPYIRLS